MPTEALFLGVDHFTPAAGDDTASLLLCGRVLIDCGWACTLRLQACGRSPFDVDHLFLTHCHHDHYLGLPGLLFYRWQRDPKREHPPLVIAGPREDLKRVVGLAEAFLQAERFAWRPRLELRPLEPGDRYETEHFRIAAARSVHPVPSLAYHLADLATGATIGLTGDTAYHEPLIEHLRGVDLLVHEASYGPRAMREADNPYGHSGAPDAAHVARLAEVGRLALVHAPPAAREAAVAAAREIFPNTWWPEPGERVEVNPRG